MSAASDPVTFETDYWALALPSGWQHQPIMEDGLVVSSDDDTKKIFVKVLVPKFGGPNDIEATIARFGQTISSSHDKTLNPTHTQFVSERGLLPPYSTSLFASYDPIANFGIASMIFVTTDHQLYLSVHDYWTEERSAFERLFRSVIHWFTPIASKYV